MTMATTVRRAAARVAAPAASLAIAVAPPADRTADVARPSGGGAARLRSRLSCFRGSRVGLASRPELPDAHHAIESKQWS